jgi:hypothetical protein
LAAATLSAAAKALGLAYHQLRYYRKKYEL